jgi:hypothetical protein
VRGQIFEIRSLWPRTPHGVLACAGNSKPGPRHAHTTHTGLIHNLTDPYHPGGNPGADLRSISHRYHPILVAFVWELTKKHQFAPGLPPGWGGGTDIRDTVTVPPHGTRGVGGVSKTASQVLDTSIRPMLGSFTTPPSFSSLLSSLELSDTQSMSLE